MAAVGPRGGWTYDGRTAAGKAERAAYNKRHDRYEEKKAAQMRKIRNGRAKRGSRGGVAGGLG